MRVARNAGSPLARHAASATRPTTAQRVVKSLRPHPEEKAGDQAAQSSGLGEARPDPRLAGPTLEEHGRARDDRTGLFRIGSIEPAATLRLTPLLGRLRRRRPGLRIRLEVGGTSGVSRAVADGDLDVGLCSAPQPELGLAFEPLFAEEMALLIPAAHPLARTRTSPSRISTASSSW